MPVIKVNGMAYAGSPVADSLPFDDTNAQLGVDNTQAAIEAVNEKIETESLDIHADLDLLFGRDNTVTYDDIPSMVLGVHNSLSNYQSVCKNYSYSTNSALVIGNRYSSGRGRYLVLPRTNVVAYLYQVKDDGAYNVRTIATAEDLASYALKSDLQSLQNASVQSTTINNIQVVSSLPSDAASHTDTLYIITE